MFTTTYKPTTIKEFVGNKQIIQPFIEWLLEWDANDKKKKFLTGSKLDEMSALDNKYLDGMGGIIDNKFSLSNEYPDYSLSPKYSSMNLHLPTAVLCLHYCTCF